MKQLLFICLSIFSISLFGQTVEGVITYEEKLNLHKKLPNEEMKAYVPEFKTANKELLIKGQQSVYRSLPDDSEIESGQDGVRLSFKTSGGEIHKDMEKKTSVEDKEFMGRRFIIDGELKSRSWKMGTGSKEILGYNCNKAMLSDSTGTTEVWFTLALASPSGPANYHGLPGTILEVNKNDGEIIMTATNIKLGEVDDKAFAAPKKGKKVTGEEFKAIVEEKMKEMGATKGKGGGNIMIIKQ